MTETYFTYFILYIIGNSRNKLIFITCKKALSTNNNKSGLINKFYRSLNFLLQLFYVVK